MTLDNFTAQLILESHDNDWRLDNITEPHIQPVENRFLIQLVISLNNLYNFKNFVFYISDRVDLKHKDAIDFFHNFWHIFPTAPNIILRRAYNATCTMAEFISTPSLIILVTTEVEDPIMELAAQTLRSVRWLKTIFLLLPILRTKEFYVDFDTFTQFGNAIRLIFDWIWKKQFLNTLLLTINGNIYIQEPYPSPVIINKTDQWIATDFFAHYNNNMRGYQIFTPVLYDLPRVFKTDRKRNQFENSYIRGTSGSLFLSFLEFVNATLNDTSASYGSAFEMTALLELVNRKVYEIIIHSFSAMRWNLEMGQSYPIGINDWCLMVPYLNKSPEYLFLRGALQRPTWLLLWFSVIYLCFAIWLCSPLRPRDLSAAFLQAINSIILAVPTSILIPSNLRIRYLFVMLFLMGFICSNMYVSKLTSFLTTLPTPTQINTIDDIINHNIRIMIVSHDYQWIEDHPHLFPQKFLNQLDIVTKAELDNHRDQLNVSYGYSVTSDRWDFIDRQQRHLRKPVFRMTDICMGPFFHVYPMFVDSHLRSPLQEFIMIVQQSGFIQKWESESFLEALHLQRVHMIIANEEQASLSMSFFTDMWHFWSMGVVLAGLVFIFEVKWFHYKRQRRRHISRLTKRKPRSFLRRLIRI